MAKAVIRDSVPGHVKYIKEADTFRSKIYQRSRKAVITEHLPFRVKFTTIGINAYGPNNPAPIGIAVVGYNNYIL